MNKYFEFFEKLNKYELINPIYKYVMGVIYNSIKNKYDEEKIINYEIIFSIYFSLINDGNITISLDKDILLNKWDKKIDETSILLCSDNRKEDINEINKDLNIIKEYSLTAINNHLIEIKNLNELFGEHNIFKIDNNYLYLNKYYDARIGIIDSIRRLFPDKELNKDVEIKKTYKSGDFILSDKQHKAATRGINNNLIITGGPGTGKTTSIFFILFNLLKTNIDYDIKLVAPSGKAASRMKDSIIKNISLLTNEELEDPTINKIINKLEELEGSTIHRLLKINPSTSLFTYNKSNKFSPNSIFVIDEASMIDIELFNSLLESIDDNSRVFIMGDKNQLPSVDVGAVFSDLLNKDSYLNKYVVELDESKRFPDNSNIFKLAFNINNGRSLNLKEEDFKSYLDFSVDKNEDKNNDSSTPIHFYLDNYEKVYDREIIKHISNIWYDTFFKELYEVSKDLDYEDDDNLKKIFSLSELSRILVASNEGYRGTKYINELISKNIIATFKDNRYKFNYPGELMIINKNNTLLDLYNGDAGILVTFKDDPTLYFMVRKSSKMDVREEKLIDKIFKKGDYFFYPLRLIAKSEIDIAYAITIHKSQGSDYENILVILPKSKGNPLLNRQILYTAITRTKKRTYIVSSIDRLNEAKDNILIRDSNIII